MSGPILALFFPADEQDAEDMLSTLPWSPDLTPPDFFLWGYLKDVVYCTKLATLKELWQEI
jgi:hypothetical protein